MPKCCFCCAGQRIVPLLEADSFRWVFFSVRYRAYGCIFVQIHSQSPLCAIMEIKLSIEDEQLKKLIKQAVREVLKEEQELLSNTTGEELLTQKQAAELLQVTVYTIIRWQNSGELPVVRVGRAVRYRKADVLGLKEKG